MLYEVGDHPDRGLLEERSIDTQPATLEWIRYVMRHEPVGDTALVDLYSNKGAADPGLIAVALFEESSQDGQFFADSWVLVTNDRAVVERAKARGVDVIEPSQLAAMIDSSG